MTHDDKWGAIACLVGAMLCYSAVPIFLRFFIKNEAMDPWAVNALRYSMGALFWAPAVLVLTRRRKAEDGPAPSRSVWRDALVPSAVNLVGQSFYGVSPAYVSAPTIGFVIRLSFLFTLLFGFLFIAEERRLARRPAFLAGAMLCVAGLVTMFVERLAAEGTASVTGLLILLVSTLGWGGYAVAVRKRMAGYPVRLSFGVISLYTWAGLVVLSHLFGRPASLGCLSAGLWAALIVSGLIGVTFSHVMYYRGIHRLGPVVSSGVLMATPFITYAGAAVLLGEVLTRTQLLGGIAVVAGGVSLVMARGQVEARVH